MGRFSRYNRNEETITIASYGAAGYVSFQTEKFWANDVCLCVYPNEMIINKYLYYCLICQQNYLYSKTTKAIPDHIPTVVIRNLKIPVPPIEVQSEVVRILDTFTSLTDEIKSELALRKKQYEYYKIKLLTFGKEVPRKKLTEIFNTKNGYTPSKSKKEYWERNEVSWFRMEDIRENGRILDRAIQGVSRTAIKGKPFERDSIIVSTSATIGEHALIKCEFIANQRFTCLKLKDEYKNKYDIKFLFYYCYVLDDYCKNNLNQGNFASVDMKKFNAFEFPMPPLAEQERIVSILDCFDKLCNDHTEGLPVEIEGRKKQYEYYRDKLLSFKEKHTNTEKHIKLQNLQYKESL